MNKHNNHDINKINEKKLFQDKINEKVDNKEEKECLKTKKKENIINLPEQHEVRKKETKKLFLFNVNILMVNIFRRQQLDHLQIFIKIIDQ